MSNSFTAYQQTIATNTLARQRNDLKQFADSLGEQGLAVSGAELFHEPASWSQVTAVHLQTFIDHQLTQSFTPSTINVRLATLRRYARLAHEAGVLSDEQVKKITAVSNLSIANTQTHARRGNKKATPILLSAEDAAYLKTPQTNHPQARRDALLMCLLLDHGLRASEAAALTWSNVDLANKTLTTPRNPPTVQPLSADAKVVLENCRHDYPKGGFSQNASLLLSTTRALNNGTGGHLIPHTPLDRITISKRVAHLGKYLGYVRKKQVTRKGKPVTVTTGTLGAQDCRHYCATVMAQRGYNIDELCDWFGWRTGATAQGYIESVTNL